MLKAIVRKAIKNQSRSASWAAPALERQVGRYATAATHDTGSAIREIAVKAIGSKYKTEVVAGKHKFVIDEPSELGGNDAGPDALVTSLGALAGCDEITAQTVAGEMRMQLDGIEFDVKAQYDPRGFLGAQGVTPYFKKVVLNAKVKTNESQEKVDELERTVHRRCPLFRMFKDAGVPIESKYTKAA
eukprot:GEZU01013523.1.p1 GENE.GEZU01013523.1~~GEZU01013523.1.p1  ORF type:complete len:187 (+),score=37.55 GEZU01013523.1:840-1400(+)